ncbi:MAG TPA: nickel pincer cofactor biosynthesis protein LarC, partial [Chloroflexota bacterium]|nr:nickel pincer cofactor biosynthesis protein LarC [Chloroflexota bacterium]
SGDMLLGALLDAGVPLDDLQAGLASLPITGWQLTAAPVQQHGLSGTRASVEVEASQEQPHRGLHDVEAIVGGATGLPESVRERACGVFHRLAEVEAAIHATSVEAVHFHEVGAVDAIVDVVGVLLGLHLLEVDWSRIVCSGLPTGSGWVRASHGRLPVPAPATLELLRRAGAPTRTTPETGEPSGELTTPTGAALLTAVASFGPPPPLRVERIGYGFGTRRLPWPNAVRLWTGALQAGASAAQLDQVAQIETHLDDATPEQLGFAMERLLEAGALDVAFVPLQMKKNRPGVLVRVLARPADGHRFAELLLEHTSALGARVQVVERLIAARGEQMVETPWGPVRVKLKHLGERSLAAPEYEDCARVARAAGVPLSAVYAAATASALR